MLVITSADKTITNKLNYQSILIDIWKSMPTQKILQNTQYNFKLSDEKGKNGFNWREDINMSFQSKDANGAIKEINNMINVNKYNIQMKIILENGKIISFIK